MCKVTRRVDSYATSLKSLGALKELAARTCDTLVDLVDVEAAGDDEIGVLTRLEQPEDVSYRSLDIQAFCTYDLTEVSN